VADLSAASGRQNDHQQDQNDPRQCRNVDKIQFFIRVFQLLY